MNKPLQALGNIHHAAYRCVDAEQTRWFYEDLLGLTLAAAFEEDIDFGENLGRNRHFLHIFFEMADGNYIAFLTNPVFPSQSILAAKIASTCTWHSKLNRWIACANGRTI